MALTPNLTPLDRRVLEAVQTPNQPSMITSNLVGPGVWPHEFAERREEVVAILRGLEHLGLVKRKAGGWWVAT